MKRMTCWIVNSLLLAAIAIPAGAQPADEIHHTQALQRYRNGQELLRAEQSYMALKRYASAIQAFTGCREAYRKLMDMREENRMATDRRIEDEIRELQNSISLLRGGQAKQYGNPETKITELEARIDELRRIQQEPVGQFRPPAEVSLALGSAYFRNGNAQMAETEWKAAIAVKPKLGEAHNNLAVIYMQTGRFKEAEQSIKNAEKAGFRVNPRLKEDLKKAASGR